MYICMSDLTTDVRAYESLLYRLIAILVNVCIALPIYNLYTHWSASLPFPMRRIGRRSVLHVGHWQSIWR